MKTDKTLHVLKRKLAQVRESTNCAAWHRMMWEATPLLEPGWDRDISITHASLDNKTLTLAYYERIKH